MTLTATFYRFLIKILFVPVQINNDGFAKFTPFGFRMGLSFLIYVVYQITLQSYTIKGNVEYIRKYNISAFHIVPSQLLFILASIEHIFLNYCLGFLAAAACIRPKDLENPRPAAMIIFTIMSIITLAFQVEATPTCVSLF